MKRLHVHVSVDNLSESVRFYSTMFAVEPAILKEDYAKWLLEDPRVNFAISQRGAKTGLNHLGIQVESDTELSDMQSRLESLQPGVEKEKDVACCYAKSDKYWVTDPSGIAWETFHTLDNIPVWGSAATLEKDTEQSGCCAPVAMAVPLMPIKREATGTCVPMSGQKSDSCC